MTMMKKREFLAAGLGLGVGLGLAGGAFAQSENEARRGGSSIPRKQAKTTVLFKAPAMGAGNWVSAWPNSLDQSPEGLWIGEQRHDGKPEAAWLVDWNGKLLKTVTIQSKDTSGLAYGDGFVWSGANVRKGQNGVFQTDMNSKPISVHQIPLGPADNGGSCHGMFWHEGKLWIVANRVQSILRVDPKSWTAEYEIPIIMPPEAPRYHDICWDDGAIWIVTGNDSKQYSDGRPGIAKIDAASGRLLEVVEFLPGSCDPHGLTMHNGVLYGSDAGEHPGWPIGTDTIETIHSTTGGNSPFGGSIFRIDII
jgi:hypothetical protein